VHDAAVPDSPPARGCLRERVGLWP